MDVCVLASVILSETYVSFSFASSVPDDLTPEERQELESIRRRKQELLQDIQVRSINLSSTCPRTVPPNLV